MLTDTVNLVHDIINDKKKRMIVEGANAVMLDLDFGLNLFLFYKITKKYFLKKQEPTLT